MKTYHCPVCKKPLTRGEYERALGILAERERYFERDKTKLQSKLRKAEALARSARQQGIEVERARTRRLLAGKEKQIQALKERLEQVERGSTPQTEGLEFENKLTARLKREFPDDEIQHFGKNGDVLHTVRFDRQEAGVIIYECKRTPKILSQHVRQAYRSKQSRDAHYAVLVTTGQKRGFSGLARMDGVLVVSPLGVVPLAALLRAFLIEMLKAKVAKEERVRIAERLVDHITSPQFKNPIEEIIQGSTELQSMIKEEAKEHFRIWKRRWEHYQKIHLDSSQVRENIELVLHGKEPKAVAQRKVPPLELPVFTG